MRLFESSLDGDVEGVKYILDAGVPVDVQDPVRQCIIIICALTFVVYIILYNYTLGFRYPYVTVHA